MRWAFNTALFACTLPQAERGAALGTRWGMLMNEVLHTPGAVLKPLLNLLHEAADLCIGDFKSSFATLLQFLVRVATRVDR